MTCILQIDKLWNGQPAAEDEHATVELEPTAPGIVVRVTASFHGDPAPPARPGPCDRLWQFEVVEVFLAGRPDPGDPSQRVPYTEIELSPHGHHLVLRLLGTRNPIDLALPLAYRAAITGASWQGEALVPASFLPHGPLRGNAYALHGEGVDRRYLAAFAVPGARPDFHRLDRFADLGIEAAPAESSAEAPAKG